MPKFKYSSKGVDTSTPNKNEGFMVAPGYYNVAIVSFEEKWTAKQDAMLRLTCLIDDKGNPFNGRKIFHNVTFIEPGKPGSGMTIHFLKTIGEPHEGEFEVSPENWIGKRMYVKMENTKYNNKTYLNVVGVMPPSDGITFSQEAKNTWLKESNAQSDSGKPEKEEEVPF